MRVKILVKPNFSEKVCGIAQDEHILMALSWCCTQSLNTRESGRALGYTCNACGTEIPPFKPRPDLDSMFKPTCDLKEVAKNVPPNWVRAVLNNKDVEVHIS